jgi:uncharacterized protein YrrD
MLKNRVYSYLRDIYYAKDIVFSYQGQCLFALKIQQIWLIHNKDMVNSYQGHSIKDSVDHTKYLERNKGHGKFISGHRVGALA